MQDLNGEDICLTSYAAAIKIDLTFLKILDINFLTKKPRLHSTQGNSMSNFIHKD